MSAISSIKKYIVLAVSGAAIIGLGTFFLLNSYFERVEIVVAGADIPTGKELEEKDLSSVEYYRNSLPEGHIEKKDEAVGKKLACERKAGDPITASVFEQDDRVSIAEELDPGEVLMALNIPYVEPLIEELHAGSRISIVSTEKEKVQGFAGNAGVSFDDADADDKKSSIKKAGSDITGNSINNVIDTGIAYSMISPNIVIIDGQIIIKNLEIVDIRTPEAAEENLLIGSKKNNPYIFIKCNINEAPVISRVTRESNYKIFMEKT